MSTDGATRRGPASAPRSQPCCVTGAFGNAVGLSCRECGHRRELGPHYACPECFGPLEVAYDFPAVTREQIEAGPAQHLALPGAAAGADRHHREPEHRAGLHPPARGRQPRRRARPRAGSGSRTTPPTRPTPSRTASSPAPSRPPASSAPRCSPAHRPATSRTRSPRRVRAPASRPWSSSRATSSSPSRSTPPSTPSSWSP